MKPGSKPEGGSSSEGRKAGKLYIGTSGWSYDWKIFYPDDIQNKGYLNYYSRHFNTVEVNYSFYHLPKVATYQKWKEQTPEGFVFSLKLSRFITHIKRLKDVEEQLYKFAGNAVALESKLGPILVQLPPSFKFDPSRLEAFLQSARSVSAVLPDERRLRIALEFRNNEWFQSDYISSALEILREHNAAFVFAHSSRYPYPGEEPLTADFVYLRFHGPEEMFASAYGKVGLKAWKQKIKRWLSGNLDVFAYFNNDVNGYAVMDAEALKELTG